MNAFSVNRQRARYFTISDLLNWRHRSTTSAQKIPFTEKAKKINIIIPIPQLTVKIKPFHYNIISYVILLQFELRNTVEIQQYETTSRSINIKSKLVLLKCDQKLTTVSSVMHMQKQRDNGKTKTKKKRICEGQ